MMTAVGWGVIGGGKYTGWWALRREPEGGWGYRIQVGGGSASSRVCRPPRLSSSDGGKTRGRRGREGEGRDGEESREVTMNQRMSDREQ
eukprot:746033-Hanusia_phi.AAC.2